MNENRKYFYEEAGTFVVFAEIKTKKRIIGKNIKTKVLHIGCQKFSEQTVEELASAFDYIENIDMGMGGILTQFEFFIIYKWFRNL